MGTHEEEQPGRVAVLRAYGILDTPRETEFDRITHLAAGICRTPVALISLVDADRIWLKSAHGVDWQACERAAAFCAHTIAQREVFVVEDAALDARFAASPLVAGDGADAGLRFYAGMPLVTPDGIALGALAVLDRVPRTLDALQREALETLAAQVITLIESRHRQRGMRDALAQKNAVHAALVDGEARWRLLFERNPLPMWVYDQATLRFLAVNDAAVTTYGWTRDEFLAMTIADIRPVEDGPALQADLALRRTGLHAPQLWRHRVRDGRIIHVDITAHSLPFDGRAGRLVLAHDVTERVLAENALRDSEAQWRRLFQASATGITACAADGRFVSANPAFSALTGRSETELMALGFLDITHPDDRPSCAEGLASLQRGEVETATFEKRYVRPDGSIVWSRAAVALTTPGEHQAAQFVAVVQDIDAQRAAEEHLKQSHALIRLAGRMARLGGWAIEMPQRTVRWSEELLAILDCEPGYTPGLEETLNWYTPAARARVERVLEACLTNGTPFDTELEIRTARGRLLAVRVIGQALRDENGRVLRAEGALLDLTAERAADARLREQAALLDEAQDAIIVRDLDGRVTYWNRSATRIFGWRADEALGQASSQLLHEDPLVAETVRSELALRGASTATVVGRCKDGSRVVFDGRWTLLRDADGAPHATLAIKTDVTRRTDLEAQLQQASRLEAVGQLTGGVAHDFNNLLTVILGNADLLAEQLADQPLLLPLAEMTRTAAERGAELTQRLLAFARRQPLQPQAVDAHQLLAAMSALLRRTLPENIELEVVRAAGQWPALVDPVQLESAVLNLVLNARDAMPGGGKITLETLNASIDLDYAERHADVMPGQYVMLSVSDTGAGMTAAQLARAFEPSTRRRVRAGAAASG